MFKNNTFYPDDYYLRTDISHAKYYFHGNTNQKITRNYSEAFRRFQKLNNETSNSTVQYYLGLHYLYGNGCPQNPALGFKFLANSARQHNREARLELAKCLYHGRGVQKNISEAFKAFNDILWETGNAECKYYLGLIYLNENEPFKQDVNTAIHFLECAALNLHVQAMVILAQIYYEKLPERNALNTLFFLLLANKFGYTPTEETIKIIYLIYESIDGLPAMLAAKHVFIDANHTNPQTRIELENNKRLCHHHFQHMDISPYFKFFKNVQLQPPQETPMRQLPSITL